MESTITFCILNQTVPLSIFLSGSAYVRIRCLREVILINKIIPGIVGGIYINHLYLTKIIFAQQFEHFEVVPFDIQILCRIEVDTFGSARAERHI